MGSLLKTSQSVKMQSSGLPCIVEQFLGGGGQGEVYRAVCSGKTVALKWYFPHQATRGFIRTLGRLINVGPPNDRFLWPMELALTAEVRGFGYVMPLRELHYKSIADLMKRRTEPCFRAIVTAGMELADSFLRLHARGLCYRDISFGNVFFDPQTGSILICDNDNVAVNGEAHVGVLGTPRFMAPEVVRREAMPDIQTDLYSLAVLLFYLLMVHHPLEGRHEAAIKCLDVPAMNRLYGDRPLFIFDPQDPSNAPVPGLHDNALAFWPLYPKFIRDLFILAFTEGLHNPGLRVRESVWRSAFARLRDLIVHCGCGQENFMCPDAARDAGNHAGTCWSCSREIRLPPRLLLKNHLVMLNADTCLYPHHLDNARQYDFCEPAAIMTQNPNRPGQWGLQNLTQTRWAVHVTGGDSLFVEPGRSIALARGTRIHFGSVEGEIRF